jgi:hypothetical protein
MSAVAVHARVVHVPELATRERRSHNRYPIKLEVRYSLLNGDLVERIGYGSTLNVSSNGILFEADAVLPIGRSIKLAVEWPFLLRGVCALKLHVRGTIICSDMKQTAVEIVRHEFRTAGIRAPGASSPKYSGDISL